MYRREKSKMNRSKNTKVYGRREKKQQHSFFCFHFHRTFVEAIRRINMKMDESSDEAKRDNQSIIILLKFFVTYHGKVLDQPVHIDRYFD